LTFLTVAKYNIYSLDRSSIAQPSQRFYCYRYTYSNLGNRPLVMHIFSSMPPIENRAHASNLVVCGQIINRLEGTRIVQARGHERYGASRVCVGHAPRMHSELVRLSTAVYGKQCEAWGSAEQGYA